MPKVITLEEVNNRLIQVGFKPIITYYGLTREHELECPGCSKPFTRRITDVLRGYITSCGCLKGRKRRRGTVYVPMEYYSCVKQHARSRNLEFSITIDYISNLLVEQDFKCALSRLPIELYYGGIKHSKNTASLDRINNSIGYITNNIQWLHKDVNWMKQDFEEKYFLDLCLSIADNHRIKHGH